MNHRGTETQREKREHKKTLLCASVSPWFKKISTHRNYELNQNTELHPGETVQPGDARLSRSCCRQWRRAFGNDARRDREICPGLQERAGLGQISRGGAVRGNESERGD